MYCWPKQHAEISDNRTPSRINQSQKTEFIFGLHRQLVKNEGQETAADQSQSGNHHKLIRQIGGVNVRFVRNKHPFQIIKRRRQVSARKRPSRP